MVELGRALRDLGITVWVAGGPAARVVEARAVGAVLNLWDADPALVVSTAQAPRRWRSPGRAAAQGGATLETRTFELAQAGATW